MTRLCLKCNSSVESYDLRSRFRLGKAKNCCFLYSLKEYGFEETVNNIFTKQSGLAGLFKEAYSDSMNALVPDQIFVSSKVWKALQKEVKTDTYIVPVVLKEEHGFNAGFVPKKYKKPRNK